MEWFSLNEAYLRYHKSNNHWSHWHKKHISQGEVSKFTIIHSSEVTYKYRNHKLKDIFFSNEDIIKALLGKRFIPRLEELIEPIHQDNKSESEQKCQTLFDDVNDDLAIVPKIKKEPIVASVINDNEKKEETINPAKEMLLEVSKMIDGLISENTLLKKERIELKSKLIKFESANIFRPLLFREVTDMLRPVKGDVTLGGNLLINLLKSEGILNEKKIPFPFFHKYFNVITRYVGLNKDIPSTTTYVNELGLKFIKELLIEKGYVICQ